MELIPGADVPWTSLRVTGLFTSPSAMKPAELNRPWRLNAGALHSAELVSEGIRFDFNSRALGLEILESVYYADEVDTLSAGR